MPETQIPEGYREDGVGRLVPEETIEEIDKLRDELVLDLIRKAKVVGNELSLFKKAAFDDLLSFVELSAEKYGKKEGGKKGTIKFFSYNGKYRLERVFANIHVFDERLQIAKALIDECLSEWGEDSPAEIRLLMNDVFQVDQHGNLNVKRILSLRKFKIEDERWQQAMAAISDSLTVVGTREYLRFYERVEGTDEMRQIPLDMSRV